MNSANLTHKQPVSRDHYSCKTSCNPVLERFSLGRMILGRPKRTLFSVSCGLPNFANLFKILLNSQLHGEQKRKRVYERRYGFAKEKLNLFGGYALAI
jgi:hypothetical protein